MCWKTILVILIHITYLCLKLNGVCAIVKKCSDEDTGLYILRDHTSDEVQLVKVTHKASLTAIERCSDDSSVTSARKFDPDEVLANVTALDLIDVFWPPVPDSSALVNVSMSDVTPLGTWGGCSNLSTLVIMKLNSSKMSPDWLANCSRLYDLVLFNLEVSSVHSMLRSAPAIQNILLYEVEYVVNIEREPLFDANRTYPSIVELQLWETEDTWPNSLEAAEAHNTTWASVSAALVSQVSLLPNLQRLTIRQLTHFDLCAGINSSSPVTFQSLQRLEISGSSTSRLCMKNFRVAPHLTELHLRESEGFDLQFRDLFSARAPHLILKLDTSLVLSIEFKRDDYLVLTDGNRTGHVEISTKSRMILANCDCDYLLWLTQALREELLEIEGLPLTCMDGKRYKDLSCDWPVCERVYCRGDCVCCRDSEGKMTVDCRDAGLSELSTELLTLANVSQLIARNNNITTLPEYIPDTIKKMDLSRNDLLRRISADNVTRLFFNTSRRLYLSGNPVNCSCANVLLVRTLQKYKHQIDDYGSLTCTNTTRLVDLNTAELCEVQDREAKLVLIVTTTVAVAVLTLAVGVGIYYRRSIEIFLFARGWCLCCLREDELDADRHYDVFLSFCHADADLVLEQMLPTLDQDYSVCIHLRDWYPGEMIPTQVRMSVEASKRTVIVLSKNFAKSLWGLLEFQTAYASGISEGRNRVVMVILDDVLETFELPGELVAYVSYNTYVKWGDPWFWSKLRYALPHRPLRREESSQPHENTPNDRDIESAIQIQNPEASFDGVNQLSAADIPSCEQQTPMNQEM